MRAVYRSFKQRTPISWARTASKEWILPAPYQMLRIWQRPGAHFMGKAKGTSGKGWLGRPQLLRLALARNADRWTLPDAQHLIGGTLIFFLL